MASSKHCQVVGCVLAAVVILGSCATAWAAEFAGGTGEPNDPYQIATAEQLTSIGSDPNLLERYFVLVSDVDLDPNLPGGRVFTTAIVAPCQNSRQFEFTGRRFEGSFDGKFHEIRDLTIVDPCGGFLGLFGCVGTNGRVSNLTLCDVRARGDWSIAGLAGLNRGHISGCTVTGTIDASGSGGALVGTNMGSVWCSGVTATVHGGRDTGGLVGANEGVVRMCCSRGKVTGGNAGGLIGNNRNGHIISCYSAADVEGRTGSYLSDYVGGLVGYGHGGVASYGSGSIVTSYATGNVRGSARSGGLVAVYGNAYLSYWDLETTGRASSSAGRGRKTEQMKSPETFRGWGSDGAWVLDAGRDYPRLAWEGLPGEPLVNQPDRYACGSGEPNDPYQIETAEQFCNIAWYREDFDKHFVLTANIDLRDVDPENILPIATNGVPFTGVFDGQRHVLANFRYIWEEDYVGVFGAIGHPRAGGGAPKGVVRNLTAENVDISGRTFVGGLAGASAGLIDSCGISGRVQGYDSVGGLAGLHVAERPGMVVRSYSTCAVEGSLCVGGLVGSNGQDWQTATISSCYSTGNVKGVLYVGGIAGWNHGTIATSYSTSPVTGNLQADPPAVGGLVGVNEGVSYLSYWDMEASAISTSAAGAGKTTAQMMIAPLYRGWGTSGEWTIQDGTDYPRLAWEGRTGQSILEPEHGYSGGIGDPDDPFQIWTPADFIAVAYHQNDFAKHFVLMQDIDLGGVDPNLIVPIGCPAFPFSGVFNGNHHTIHRFRRLLDNDSYVGVFGYVDANGPGSDGSGGRITNLHLRDAEVTGHISVALLAGCNEGTIEACTVDGTVRGTRQVGGLAGWNGSIVSGSHVVGDVIGGWAVGGVAGGSAGGVASCSFDGTVMTNADSVGGIVGRNHGTIEACCSRGSVRGKGRVGGIVGDDYGSTLSCYSRCSVVGTEDYVGGVAGASWRRMAYCYSAGTVDGAGYVGGLVGAGDRAFNCYWDIESSGISTSNTGRGRTTNEMMRAGTFRGWGYPGVWMIDEGRDYPRLAWEGIGGRPIVDPAVRYSGGTGERNAPYEIRTPEDFAAIAYYQQDFDKHFVLMNDVDLRDLDPDVLMPIGARFVPFTGVFDGGRHVVAHFTYANEQESYVGVFSAVAKPDSEKDWSTGVVKNLGVVDANLYGRQIVGGIAALNRGTITSCYVTDTVCAALWANVGGLVGNNEGLLFSCRSSGSVRGQWTVGGLAGYSRGRVDSSYSTSAVAGTKSVGGLVGASAGAVLRCYSAGAVTGDTHVGGILGSSVSYDQVVGEESWNFWDVQVCGLGDGVGNLDADADGVLGKTTQEMRTAATFLNAGWDFETVWMICEGADYPRLLWEGVECDK